MSITIEKRFPVADDRRRCPSPPSGGTSDADERRRPLTPPPPLNESAESTFPAFVDVRRTVELRFCGPPAFVSSPPSTTLIAGGYAETTRAASSSRFSWLSVSLYCSTRWRNLPCRLRPPGSVLMYS